MLVIDRLPQSVTDVASPVTSVPTVHKDRENHALQLHVWLTKGKRMICLRIIPRRRYRLRFLRKKTTSRVNPRSRIWTTLMTASRVSGASSPTISKTN